MRIYSGRIDMNTFFMIGNATILCLFWIRRISIFFITTPSDLFITRSFLSSPFRPLLKTLLGLFIRNLSSFSYRRPFGSVFFLFTKRHLIFYVIRISGHLQIFFTRGPSAFFVLKYFVAFFGVPSIFWVTLWSWFELPYYMSSFRHFYKILQFLLIRPSRFLVGIFMFVFMRTFSSPTY